ncbi:MAG TPA: DUF2298 domain-containing protein [Thermoanaerobaculia bacterium]|nr:DUF2298 domain-containing protein [Thermoanaerobaculia bacterium]
MVTILVWYLAVQCVGVVGSVLTARAFPALPDRGYCAGKTIGVVLVGVVLWLGTAAGLLRNGVGGALLSVLAVLAIAASARGREGSLGDLVGWVRANRGLVIAAEALFLVAFAAWCWVRAHDPAADHTEEPMDLMLLVAVSTSDSFPPRDPWLSGYPISYYYLGYWLLATLGHLAGTVPELTYNLAQATWFALLLLGSFGLGYDLASLSGHGAAASGRRLAIGTGLGAAAVVGLTANLALPLEWIGRSLAGTADTLRTENWWWWRSSRVVQDRGVDGATIEAITEFPFFSYLLGDNHPHVLSMPVVLAALTLALAVFARAVPPPAAGSRRIAGAVGGPAALVVILVVVGSITAINTWDVPMVWSIVVVAAAAAAARAASGASGASGVGGEGEDSAPAARPGRSAARRVAVAAAAAAVATGGLLALGSSILFLPYHLTATSQVRGIVPNLLHPTAFDQVFVMFATLAPGVALLVAGAWDPAAARFRRALALWIAIVGAAALWLAVAGALATWGGAWDGWLGQVLGARDRSSLPRIALGRWLTGWPTLALLAAGLALTLETLRARWMTVGAARADGVTFALLLAAAGVGLVLLPEILYLHDSFGTRMNTVFKFWYQAWPLLACAGTLGIALAWKRGGRQRAAALLGVLGLAPGLLYPVAALDTKTAGFGSPDPTLDASAWIERWRPAELEAIQWIRRSTPADAVVVQRSGDSYRAEHNLPSILTGRATLLGWGGHEYQWRGAAFGRLVAGREEALARIYAPPSREELTAALAAWKVGYVYLGPEERARYGVTGAHETILADAMDVVFENDAVRIYRARDSG